MPRRLEPRAQSLRAQKKKGREGDPPAAHFTASPWFARQNAKRKVNCIMRMLFACALIWPNDELPKALLVGAAH